ncbi:MAG: hypothetical protein PHF56_24330 [Desulfuromonadaceae bacterium]|nr:hypothetical protein [Desulfuromonadaceae bacterium]
MKWMCPVCEAENHASLARCDCGYDGAVASTVQPGFVNVPQIVDEAPAAAVTINPPGVRFEVVSCNDETMTFDSVTELREAILGGLVTRELNVRKVTVDASEKRLESAWVPVEKFVAGYSELRALYRPIWHFTKQYAWYGVIAGFALKAVDTTITIFTANETAGLVWLLVIGSLLLSKKFPLAPAMVVFMTFKFGVQANFFITALATMLVGAMFGAPGGMVVGTIVGHCKQKSMTTAPDAEPEGKRPYWLGIGLPVLTLAALIPLYIWFNVKLVEWMAGK